MLRLNNKKVINKMKKNNRQFEKVPKQEIQDILFIMFGHGDKITSTVEKFVTDFPYLFTEKEILALKISGGLISDYKGDIDLSGIKIQTLGNLKSVGGDLWLANTAIQSLGNLKSVGGYLNLQHTTIQSLGNLQSVGGYLYLYNSAIQSLGNLQFVGSNLYLNRHITEISKTLTVKGKIIKP